MRKAFFNKAFMVLAAAGGLMLTSCHDSDVFDPNKLVKEYEKGWDNKFGAIDPNHDWSLATAKTISVSVPQASEVSIYTKGLDKSQLLAKTTVTGTKDIKFDVSKELTEVYVVAVADGSRDVRTVNITNETASADFTASRAKAARTRAGETLPERELVYALGYNFFKGQKTNAFNNDYANLIGFHYNETYNYSSWGSNIYASGKWSTDPKNDQTAPETGTDVDMTKFTDVQTGCSELYTRTDDDITKLYPFTQDYKMVTAKAQEITMTGIFRNTSGNTALLYYYTAPNASVDELKAADKYILIPNTQNIVGKEYKLIYYDPSNSYAPTYTFPANVEIHFALAINPSCCTKWVDWNNTDGDIRPNVMQGDLMSFSDEALNTDIFRDQKNWTSMASSAIYTYNGANIISFEDWGGTFDVIDGVPTPTDGNNNSIDWNDLAFTINAEFQTPPPPVEEEQEKPQSWILACEDMGSTGDYDFNDIVLDVWKTDATHVAVKCLAAGGTLPANIYLKDKTGNYNFVGESHTLLGGPDTKTMLNTFENGQKYTQANPVILEVDEKWTISEGYGDFKIAISYGDDVSESIFVGKVTAGTAPQMIVVPGDWEWPKEWQRIEDAYPDFENWSEDADKTGWVNNKVDEFIYQR